MNHPATRNPRNHPQKVRQPWQRIHRRCRILSLLLAFPFLILLSKACTYYSFRPSQVDPAHLDVRKDLIQRRNYLVSAVKGLEPHAMPSYLPEQFKGEWLAVTHSMTAMALVNLATLYPDTRSEAQSSIDELATAMLHENMRKFDTALWNEDPLLSLDGPHGHIGYLGHLALVLLAQRYIGANTQNEELLRKVSLALYRRLKASPRLLIETYPGETYVADNAAIVACLALAQPLFPKSSLDLSKAWTRKIQQNYLDPETGLMVFRIGSDGKVLEQSRGSGVGWSVFYLGYADREFAEQQYRQLKNTMEKQALGWVYGFRETVEGSEKQGWGGDVDSGPVILGLSPSGTGFAIAGATLTRDDSTKLKLLRTAELAGTTLSTGAGRRYIFSPLVGDAIVLAMRTVTAWESPATVAR